MQRKIPNAPTRVRRLSRTSGGSFPHLRSPIVRAPSSVRPRRILGSPSRRMASVFIVGALWACGGDGDSGGSTDNACNPPCPLGQACTISASGAPTCVGQNASGFDGGFPGTGGDGGGFPFPPPNPDAGGFPGPGADAGVNPGPGGLGAECDGTTACSGNLECIGNGAVGVCTQQCSEASPPCPSPSLCVLIDEQNRTGLCLVRCDPSTGCNGRLECAPLEGEGGVCIPPVSDPGPGSGQPMGAFCNANENCQSSLCVQFEGGGGFCSASCTDNSGCSNNTFCLDWGQPGSLCTGLCDNQTPCPQGLRCEIVAENAGVCIP